MNGGIPTIQDDDDQFADFASVEAGSPPTVSQPSAPGAKDEEEEEDEKRAWPALWNEVAKLATAGLAMSLEDEAAAVEQAPGSDDWIRAAVHMPEEALLKSPGRAVHPIWGLRRCRPELGDSRSWELKLPFSRSLGSTVREGFFAALGKHLQLPSSKPEAMADVDFGFFEGQNAAPVMILLMMLLMMMIVRMVVVAVDVVVVVEMMTIMMAMAMMMMLMMMVVIMMIVMKQKMLMVGSTVFNLRYVFSPICRVKAAENMLLLTMLEMALAGVSAVPAQALGQAAPVQSVGAEEAMADVDFGFFEVPAAATQGQNAAPVMILLMMMMMMMMIVRMVVVAVDVVVVVEMVTIMMAMAMMMMLMIMMMMMMMMMMIRKMMVVMMMVMIMMIVMKQKMLMVGSSGFNLRYVFSPICRVKAAENMLSLRIQLDIHTGNLKVCYASVMFEKIPVSMSRCPDVQCEGDDVQLSLDADVLSQALSSVGLQNTAATSTVTMTPDIALTADVGVAQVKKKKKGMTQKVKSFLSGLPDLKHLYSKSVVECCWQLSDRYSSRNVSKHLEDCFGSFIVITITSTVLITVTITAIVSTMAIITFFIAVIITMRYDGVWLFSAATSGCSLLLRSR
ncbi:hypothetical protein AK812_SmicGene30290 [Symbiodinium microadriaticum]|uniref:Uncharacterized protein n=1 Tax=Symbiodinium microadriaticum TaxID=2951 RepID=A0A1Q9CZQ7_SYMMI|nr:hypothetical protein AK812_SmicGene30290 [Symbiodinium microadriaticum]